MTDKYVPPYCSVCGQHIDDLDSNHHVCVPQPDGAILVTTRDEAHAEWTKRDEEHQAAEAAKAEDAPGPV